MTLGTVLLQMAALAVQLPQGDRAPQACEGMCLFCYNSPMLCVVVSVICNLLENN